MTDANEKRRPTNPDGAPETSPIDKVNFRLTAAHKAAGERPAVYRQRCTRGDGWIEVGELIKSGAKGWEHAWHSWPFRKPKGMR